jgi:hypothetical protein
MPANETTVNIPIILFIAGLLFSIIITLIGIVYGTMSSRITDQGKDIKELGQTFKEDLKETEHRLDNKIQGISKTSEEIKTNYLNRFAELNNNVVQSRSIILEKLNAFALTWTEKLGGK